MGQHTFDLTGNFDLESEFKEVQGTIGRFVLDDEVYKSIADGLEKYNKCNVFLIDKYVDIIDILFDNQFESGWFGCAIKHECLLLFKSA